MAGCVNGSRRLVSASMVTLRNLHCILYRSLCLQMSPPVASTLRCSHWKIPVNSVFKHLTRNQHLSSTHGTLGEISAKDRSDSGESDHVTLETEKEEEYVPAREDLAIFLKIHEQKRQASLEEEANSEKKIQNLSEKEQNKLKMLHLEYELLLTERPEEYMPDKVTNKWWLELLKTNSKRERTRLYYKIKLEEIRALEKERKYHKHIERMREKIERQKIHGVISRNQYIMTHSQSRMNAFYRGKLCHAMKDGPHLIFDLDYDWYMTNDEIGRLFKQIWLSHGCNKLAKEPFHFILCNVEEGTRSMERLIKTTSLQDGYSIENFLVTVTDKDCIDLFPTEDLVYLSPDAPKQMTRYNPNSTYIIGGLVDLGRSKPLTFAKSKRQKIKHYKLPIDRYISWGSGSRELGLVKMVELLLALKHGATWEQAFKAVISQNQYRYIK